MTTRATIAFALFALSLGTGSDAFAQTDGRTPADAPPIVHQRRNAMVALLSNMSRIEYMVYGMAPYNPAQVKRAADEMERLAEIAYGLFPPGSASPASKAQPQVWEQREAFAQAAADSKRAIAALQAAAAGGKLDEVKAAYTKVPPACMACHATFMRQP